MNMATNALHSFACDDLMFGSFHSTPLSIYFDMFLSLHLVARLEMAAAGSTRNLLVYSAMELSRHSPPLRFLLPYLKKLQVVAGEVTTADAHGDRDPHERMALGMAQRDLFAARPPRGFFNGIVRGSRNLALATVIPPMILVASPISRGLQIGGPGVLEGLKHACIWGPILAVLGTIGAIQQVVMGLYITLSFPKRHIMDMYYWNPILRKYSPYTMGADPELENYPSAETLLTIARQRTSTRMGRSGSDVDGRATGAKSDPGGLYETLRVDPTATEREIKESYNRLAMQFHPDRNPDPDARDTFEKVTKAYKVLSNAKKRKQYDAGQTNSQGEVQLQKRDGVNTTFGGKKFVALVGEVRSGRMSRRMIDEATFYGDELTVYNLRKTENCAAELLTYLEGYTLGSAAQNAKWTADTKKKVVDLCSEGIGSSVCSVVGNEYLQSVDLIEGSVVDRMKHWVQRETVEPLLDNAKNYRAYFVMTADQRKNPEHVMNTLWDMCVNDLRVSARQTAKRALLDVSTTDEERARRRAALREFAKIMTQIGKPYTGANQDTLRKLQMAMAKQNQAAQER